MADTLTLTTCKFFNHLSFLCSFILSYPLYFSYIIFSPYLFRFFFFISPLFFTTSLLFLLSFIATSLPHSNLCFVQTIVHTIRSKLTNVDDDDDEFPGFEDLELYKIVFHGPSLPLLTVADPDDDGDVDKHMLTDTVALTVTGTELDEQRRLEILFEELDRFEASSETVKMEYEMISHVEEEAVEELQTLEPVTSPVSDEDQKSDESSFSVNSNPSRSESSSSFGSCGSIEDETTTFEIKQNKTTTFEIKQNKTTTFQTKENEARSYVEKVIGELQKSKSTAVIEKKNIETTSHVRKVLQKLEAPVTSSISVEDKKTVRSNSTAAIDVKVNETTSHSRKAFQKLEPVTSAISGEDKIPASIETKDNKTTSHVQKVLQKLEDKKSVQNTFSRCNSWRLDSSSSLGSYGSMRKEKEWKRTLACKLFEERNSSSRGEEGMDSLWEAYEDDNSSRKSKNRKEAVRNGNEKKVMMSKKKSEFKCFNDVEDEEEDDDDEFMSNGQLCCLKALKLSTGKMNLGMGKPNLVKISKAIKGFGWLHRVGSKSKKN